MCILSNNDLRCSKCNSQHHPMDCPRGKELQRPEKKDNEHIESGECGCIYSEDMYPCEVFVQAYNRAIEDYEAFLAQDSKWISVEDRLPEKTSNEFLGINMNQGGVKELINWNKVHKYWQSKRNPIFSLQITHWMPLPNLPLPDKPRDE
jgi:hypothetical protein